MAKAVIVLIKFILISSFITQAVICGKDSLSSSDNQTNLAESSSKENIYIGSPDESILSRPLVKLSTCCRLESGIKNDANRCKSKLPYENLTPVSSVWNVPDNLISKNGSTNFSLEQRKPICKKGSFHKTLFWNSSNSRDSRFYGNGYLQIGREYYALDEYCIDGFTTSGIEVYICIPDCGESRACIPKCCPLNKVYNIGIGARKGCQSPIIAEAGMESSEEVFFNPPLYHDLYTQLSKEEISQTPQPHYFLWHPANFRTNCVLNKTTLFPRSSIIAENISNHLNNSNINAIDFRIRKDGAFLYRNVAEKKCKAEKDPKRILCFDGAQDFGSHIGFTNLEDETIVFLCNVWNNENNDGLPDAQPRVLVYGILMITFSMFPLITSIVYLLLWSRQNVHGWTIATTAGALFFMYIFQGSALIIGSVHGTEKHETLGCIFVAVVSHFFFLSTFSWLTVMCCDLWWTFRSLTPTNRRSKGMKRFVKYSMFGWGVPGIFVIVGMVLDYVSDDCSSNVLPSYGMKSCWILPSSQGVYVFYPVAVLLSMNTVFFAVTCFKLCRYSQNTKVATKKETNHWQCFSRFTKLFLVMGVSWIFDLISWSIDGYTFRWYWVVFDVINILRAVGVFIVYVCKPDIIIALEDQYPSLKRAFGPFKRRCSEDISLQTGSTAATPTSTQLPTSRIL